MSTFYIVIYLVSFCLLVGCGFAMMYANLTSIHDDMNKPVKRAEPIKTVVYIDGSTEAARERFEDLYND